MKASEIRNMTGDELNKKLSDLRTELFNLRFQAITGQLGNPRRIHMVKKILPGSKPLSMNVKCLERRRRSNQMADRKRFTGEIISNKMDKTVLVRVIRISEHPFYKKK